MSGGTVPFVHVSSRHHKSSSLQLILGFVWAPNVSYMVPFV